MRALIVALVLLPLAAQAATPTFAVPADVLQHTAAFLQVGGTHAEGQALAEQLISLAQQQMAAKPAEPKAP